MPATVLRDLLIEKRRDQERPGDGAAPADSSWASAWSAAYGAASARRWPEAAENYTRLIQFGFAGDEAYIGSSLEARLGREYALLEAKEYVQAAVHFGSAATLPPE